MLLTVSFSSFANIELLPSRYKFVRHSLGIEIIKPDNWRFTNTSQVRKMAIDNDNVNEQESNKSLGEFEHVVTIVHNDTIFMGLQPSIVVATINAEEKRPSEYIYNRIINEWSKETGFRVNIHPMDTSVGGQPATYSNTGFLLGDEGDQIELMVDYWIVERKDHFLVISYVSPKPVDTHPLKEKLQIIRDDVYTILHGATFTK